MKATFGAFSIPILIASIAGTLGGYGFFVTGWLVFIVACIAQLYVLDRRDPRGIAAMRRAISAAQGTKP